MRFYRFVLKYPRSVIAAIAAVTLFFGWQMRRLELNNSVAILLPEQHPAIVQDDEIREVFNSREMVLVAVLNDAGIFNPSTLEKVKALTEDIRQVTIAGPEDERALQRWSEELGERYRDEIQALLSGGLDAADRAKVSNLLLEVRNDPDAPPGLVPFLEELQLELSPINDVISLSEVDNVSATEWGLSIDPPLRSVPASEAELDALAATVYENDMFVRGLVSEDSTGTLILAELAFHYDDHLEMADRVFERLKAVSESYRKPERIQLAGVPMVNVYTSKYMYRDLVWLTPLVVLLVVLVIYLSLRTFKGALIPIAVVLVSLVWTLGFMALLGRPVTLLLSAMPIMLIAIGSADGIHLVTEYRLLWARLRNRDEAILATMRQLTRPVVFTSLTTMAGFGSLAFSSLRAIQDFGLFTSAGVLAAMIFSLTFTPAALKLMTPAPVSGPGPAGQDRLARVLEGLGGFAVRHRRRVFVAAVGIAAVSVLAVLQISVGSTMVGLFHDESEIARASRVINAKFGGTEVMNVVIDTRRPDGLKDPQILAGIAALQDTLEASPLVGYTTSLADYVRRINYVMQGGDARQNRIPAETERVTETEWVEVAGEEVERTRTVEVSGRDLIAQYLLLYENAGGDRLGKLADYDYRKANLVVQIRTDHTACLRKIKRAAQTFAAARFGPDVAVTFAGCSNQCIVADDLIIPSQLRSLGVALGVVLLLLALVFRSARYTFVGLLPMLLTVVFVFALMSAFGVYLDSATALIASIVLGIGIDYSIHFLSRYRSLRRQGLEAAEAIGETMHTSGRAILFNSLAVAAGFLVLMLSSFWPVMHIGWLVAANMILGAGLVLVLLPALLVRTGEDGGLPAAGGDTQAKQPAVHV